MHSRERAEDDSVGKKVVERVKTFPTRSIGATTRIATRSSPRSSAVDARPLGGGVYEHPP